MSFEKIQTRYRQFWNRENTTPILYLSGLKRNPEWPKAPEKLEDRWLDIDFLIANERAYIDNAFFLGDAFPLTNPNLGPDIFGASLGCDIIFEETTSYSVPFVKDWTEDFSFHEDNKWWQKIKEITSAFVEDSKGDYLVGITDLHPGGDGLVSIRGPQNLCFDVIDQPEVFENSSKVLLPAFQKQFEELYAITQKYQTGTTNWMGVYKEDPWYVTSCDFICMISKADFQNLILPEIIEEAKYLKGNTIFHLDGPGALKHLDALLEVPEITGIQWVYGAGQPSARHWIDVLKKIQDAGKCIHIGLEPEDVEPVFRALNPQGLCCNMNFGYSEEEAHDILNLAKSIYLK